MSFLSGLLRFRPRSRSRELACQEVVELVTDYLEGALSAVRSPPGSKRTSRAARTAPSTWRRSGRRSGWPAGSGQEDLTPQMRTDLTDLYRRWRAEG